MTSVVRCARAYVGLGANLDRPRQHVSVAIGELAALPDGQLVARSSLYLSAPMGPKDQPDYINAVVALETRLPPLALLDQLQALEVRHGRRRSVRWGPRTLDLDLLLYGDQRLDHPRLTLPHPGLTQRSFVVIPLLEIAPTLRLPDNRLLRDIMQPIWQHELERLEGVT